MYMLKNYMVNIFYYLRNRNWTFILLSILAFEIAIYTSSLLINNSGTFNSHESLKIILSIHGLFSAILVSYFFNRVSWLLENKKEIYNEAVEFSQKITDFRRILHRLTKYYNVWSNDEATKSLFLKEKYRYVDYFEYKLMSFSDYSPKNKKLIQELQEEQNYEEGISDLYLGMISLVVNRKKPYQIPEPELYKHFQKKGIYSLDFIERCVEIEYPSRLGYWLNGNFNFINYNNLSDKEISYILDCAKRIDVKYKDCSLNNKLMSDVCDDMNEYYFKELYELLIQLRKGIKGLDLLIYSILISSLLFGILIPIILLFAINNIEIRNILTKIIIGLNIGLIFFFVTNLYGFIKREITWI